MVHIYPTLVSDKFVATINFYEDFFGFVSTLENDGYAVLRHADNEHVCIAVFDAAHKCIARLGQSARGIVITIAVEDIEATYNKLYMEGLEMYKEIGTDILGDRHFVVYDPNGILISVTEGKTLDMKLAA